MKLYASVIEVSGQHSGQTISSILETILNLLTSLECHEKVISVVKICNVL